MFLRLSFCSSISQRETNGFHRSCSSLNALKNLNGLSSVRHSERINVNGGLVVSASKEANNRQTLDIVFEPFEEVKKDELLLPNVPQASFARQYFTDQCEAALNEQIKLSRMSSLHGISCTASSIIGFVIDIILLSQIGQKSFHNMTVDQLFKR